MEVDMKILDIEGLAKTGLLQHKEVFARSIPATPGVAAVGKGGCI
jgi:hypothetical protein